MLAGTITDDVAGDKGSGERKEEDEIGDGGQESCFAGVIEIHDKCEKSCEKKYANGVDAPFFAVVFEDFMNLIL